MLQHGSHSTDLALAPWLNMGSIEVAFYCSCVSEKGGINDDGA